MHSCVSQSVHIVCRTCMVVVALTVHTYKQGAVYYVATLSLCVAMFSWASAIPEISVVCYVQ